MAVAYDIPAVPHGSGAYVYHYLITLPYVLSGEYVNMSPGGDALVPLFGDMFTGDPLPHNGAIRLDDSPSFGLTLNRDAVTLHRPFPG